MRSSCGFLGEGGAQVRRGRGAKKGELRGAALAGQGRAAPRQPRKVGPPTSVGQQPGPIARFADVGRLSLWRHRDQGQPARTVHSAKSGTYLKRNQSKRCENESTLSSEI